MNARLSPSAALVITALLLTGCATEAPPPAEVNPNARSVDPATSGTIAGRITFTGTPPAPEVLQMGADQACVQADTPNPVSNAVLVGDDGGLQNAFVYIMDGLDPDYTFAIPTEEAVLDQEGCIYTPRVLGVRTGQTLRVLNSDPTMHNVHALPTRNLEFNQSTPMQGTSITATFTVPEVMVKFMCNVHGWMAAWVGVVDHPYFAVTAADGTFELTGVPPGTYTVEVWHEVFGRQTTTVTLEASGSQTVDLAFSGQ